MLPWLLGVADYTARSAWRSSSCRRALSTIQNLAQDEHDHADGVADRVDKDERIRQIRAQLRRLPRHEQEIVELCVWAGLDQRAAAIALDIPVGTVKSRLSRARQHLRDLLASEEQRRPQSHPAARSRSAAVRPRPSTPGTAGHRGAVPPRMHLGGDCRWRTDRGRGGGGRHRGRRFRAPAYRDSHRPAGPATPARTPAPAGRPQAHRSRDRQDAADLHHPDQRDRPG